MAPPGPIGCEPFGPAPPGTPPPSPAPILVEPKPGAALLRADAAASSFHAPAPRPAPSSVDAASPSPLVPADPALRTASLGAFWTALNNAASDNRRLRVLLGELVPVAWARGELCVRPAPNVVIALTAMKSEVEALASRLVGESVALVIEAPAHAEDVPSGPTIASVSEHPLVKHAVQVLGARVIGVQARRAP